MINRHNRINIPRTAVGTKRAYNDVAEISAIPEAPGVRGIILPNAIMIWANIELPSNGGRPSPNKITDATMNSDIQKKSEKIKPQISPYFPRFANDASPEVK